ncbi:MAG: transporter substrate-binding domain-containing protein [Rhodospirillaceae bacterium]|nr:transporter substrate-binding domain-containing protein [Rhodospirillaceae bacterium]MCA8930839.1 transporter substrate-binding domain-containing protein [Rhodospirillaceae bacterium]
MSRLHALTAGAALLALASATASAQEVVRIGTEGAYPPWNFTDASGELVGFEIDLGNALCERMEVECEFVAQDWDGIIPALLQGNYDAIMAGMSITDERRERIAFSYGYATTPAHFVAANDSPFQDLETIDDVVAALDGVPVGVQVATIHQGFIEEYIPNADMRTYDTQEQLNLDLAAGRVEVGLADSSGWEDFLSSEDGANYSQFGPGLTGADFPIFGEGVGIGMRQEDTELRDRFNEALCSMANDGSLAALTEEWFGFDASLPCPE